MSSKPLRIIGEDGDWLPPLEQRIEALEQENRGLREKVDLLRDENGHLELGVSQQTKQLLLKDAEIEDLRVCLGHAKRDAERQRQVKERHARRLAEYDLLEEGEENPLDTKPRFNWIAALFVALAAGNIGWLFVLQRLMQGGG